MFRRIFSKSLAINFHHFQSMSRNVRVGQYSIHSRESIEFYRSLNASVETISILEHGLKLDFKEVPQAYFEENNRSCIENLQVAQSKVKKWEELGVVYKVKSRPHCTSPLTVSSKVDYLSELEV